MNRARLLVAASTLLLLGAACSSDDGTNGDRTTGAGRTDTAPPLVGDAQIEATGTPPATHWELIVTQPDGARYGLIIDIDAALTWSAVDGDPLTVRAAVDGTISTTVVPLDGGPTPEVQLESMWHWVPTDLEAFGGDSRCGVNLQRSRSSAGCRVSVTDGVITGGGEVSLDTPEAVTAVLDGVAGRPWDGLGFRTDACTIALDATDPPSAAPAGLRRVTSDTIGVGQCTIELADLSGSIPTTTTSTTTSTTVAPTTSTSTTTTTEPATTSTTTEPATTTSTTSTSTTSTSSTSTSSTVAPTTTTPRPTTTAPASTSTTTPTTTTPTTTTTSTTTTSTAPTTSTTSTTPATTLAPVTSTSTTVVVSPTTSDPQIAPGSLPAIDGGDGGGSSTLWWAIPLLLLGAFGVAAVGVGVTRARR